ncbi:3883_t:CDS:10 [Funneliformis caledonium]|uniref:Autophagy-related protein 2 n=1 Tax=Funneliformis caledonium TaxID=1117310 RepID=A0A9N9HDT1_9GLOM|nr:3883_t:CDS:10 [Funneliformis caledonium]
MCQTLLNMVNHLNPKAEDPEKGRITTDPVVQNMLANLDEYAFDSKSKSRATPAIIDDNKISKISSVLVEQPLFAAFSTNEKFVDDHFSIPNANEPENSYIQNYMMVMIGNVVKKEALDSLARANSQAKNVNVVETGTASGSSIGETIDYIDDYSDTASQVNSRLDPDNTNFREGKRSEHSNRRSRPKLSRSSSSKIDIKLEKVNLEFDIFPDDNLLAFRLLLLVRDIEILDEIKSSELGAAWLPHIKSTQVPNVVSGVAPIRSLVNLGSDVADLILLPIEQYKKDGRIIRGLQKGTESFARATTMETIRFGTKLASSTNPTASTIDEELDSEEDNIKELISKYVDRPADLNEEFTILQLIQYLLYLWREAYEKTGTQGTVKAVIRAVPVAVLKPMIGTSEAVYMKCAEDLNIKDKKSISGKLKKVAGTYKAPSILADIQSPL